MALLTGVLLLFGLAVAGVLLSSSRSGGADLAEFQAAPRCPASVECLRDTSGVVLRTYRTSSKTNSIHVVVRRADGREVDVYGPKGAPTQIATPGQVVNLTSYKDAMVEVSDPVGNIMLTDDNPVWQAENRRWGFVLLGILGVIVVAYAALFVFLQRRLRRRRAALLA